MNYESVRKRVQGEQLRGSKHQYEQNRMSMFPVFNVLLARVITISSARCQSQRALGPHLHYSDRFPSIHFSLVFNERKMPKT